MKVLVATKEGQGIRGNDFCWVPENEIVHFGFECDGGSVDDHCGCRRAMVGIDCSKATTTMKVVDLEVKCLEIVSRLKEHYVKDWKMDEKRALITAIEELIDLRMSVKQFPLGAIIEKRGDVFQIRNV